MRITKALKAEFEAKVAEIVKNYNPYIKKAIKYSVGNTPMFIYADTCMTKEEIDKAQCNFIKFNSKVLNFC